MSTRIFLGNLPFLVKIEELSSELLLAGCPPRDLKIIVDRETGASRGFAFADYGTPGEAASAMAVLNGIMVGDRPLRASPANERPGGRGGVSPRGPDHAPTSEDRGHGGGGEKRRRGDDHGARRRDKWGW